VSPSWSPPPELPGVRHDYVDVNGLRTHVALAGAEDRPPIVLVHGWPQNWWSWRHVIPQLADRFRVIAPDLRGHGWTEAPADGYEKAQLAADVLGLLDALGIDRVVWVGHDWGGFAGLLAALGSPERIERMLMLCVPHLWTERDPRQLALMLSYQGPLSLPILGPRVANPMARRIVQAGRGGDRLAEAEVSVFADHLPPRVTVAMYRTFLTRELGSIARGRYANQTLQVPTTLLFGERDLVTRTLAGGPVDGQPQLHVEPVAGVAHWLPEQRPQAIVDWAHSS
jgi:pimeloyl-ACP methyl ester carboxylesterase